MARKGNGSNQAVFSAAVTEPSLYTFHGWYRNGAAPGTTAVKNAMSLGSSDFHHFVGFAWSHTNGAYSKSVYSRGGGAYPVAQLTSTLAANTWYAIGGSYDGTNLRAWLGGVNETSVAASAETAGHTPLYGALSSYEGFGTGFDDGTLAEYAWWSVVLTAGEMKTLAAGVSPLHVRPESLLIYWPLYGTASPEPDFSGHGLAGTLTGTPTVADGPPVAPLLPGWGAAPYVVSAGGGATFSAQTAVLTTAASAATVTTGAVLSAGVPSLTVAAPSSAIAAGARLSAATPTLTVAAGAATFTTGAVLPGATPSLTVAAPAASITGGALLSGATGVLTTNAPAAAITGTAPGVLTAATPSLTLAALAATLTGQVVVAQAGAWSRPGTGSSGRGQAGTSGGGWSRPGRGS